MSSRISENIDFVSKPGRRENITEKRSACEKIPVNKMREKSFMYFFQFKIQ